MLSMNPFDVTSAYTTLHDFRGHHRRAVPNNIMPSPDDETLCHLCRLKKAQLNVLYAQNDRLSIHIFRKKASIARLNLEQSLLQDQLNTAESDRNATWSASSDGSDHLTSRALVGDTIPAATESTSLAASLMFPRYGIANPALSDKICSRPICTEKTMDNKQQCEYHIRLSREAKCEKRLRDKAAVLEGAN